MRFSTRTAAALLACLMLAGCGGSSSTDISGAGENYLSDIGGHEGYIDTLTPGIDYYGYINGRELMNMSLDNKHDRMGTYSDVNDVVDGQLDEIIEEIAADGGNYPRGSYEQILHDVYHLIQDDYSGKLGTDAEDTAVIDGILDRIDSVEDLNGLKQLWRDLALDYGVYAFAAGSSGMNLYDTNRNIFTFSYQAPVDLEKIKDSDISAVIARDAIADTLRNAGIPSSDAEKRATDIIYVMHDIASYTDFGITGGKKRTEEYYNVYRTSELSGILHNLSADDLLYISGYSGSTPDEIVIIDPGQLRAMDSFVDEEHIQVWKDLAIKALFDQYSFWMPDKYNFVKDDTLTGDKLAKNIIKGQLSSYIGEIYAKRCYTEEKRETITRICEDMKAEYYVLINGADWLSDEGKTFLTDKLDNMGFFIGADKPHEIDPSDADVVESSVLKTLIHYSSDIIRENIDKYGEAPTHNGFDTMSPCTVNACYMPAYNCINITVAVTTAPLYDENADYYTNLGRIGSIIGHEISHAFDSNGVKYDAHGNLRPDAMPEEDIKAFREKQEKVTDFYSSFMILGTRVDGKLTLGENLADISGLQCALAIAGDREKQKTVFENYARLWLRLETDTSAKKQVESDEHSPASVRVNAVVACFDEFYDIYGVKEGDPMYIAPEERVRRW
ncbi:MAG: M13 family metallopeptidase [Oscillospiraceae bacterium]|nr:M13 family metallopeptidase [Oscillospiraceae bacterium]